MRIRIAAVGRLRRSPESELVADYLDRFSRIGRALGLGPAEVVEIDDRKQGGPSAQAQQIAGICPRGAILCALDERGRQVTSPDFAATLAEWRDRGTGAVVFAIGGADGLDAGLIARADLVLSLGRMVWPHALARVMLAEQLYRAATILAGTPYHRA